MVYCICLCFIIGSPDTVELNLVNLLTRGIIEAGMYKKEPLNYPVLKFLEHVGVKKVFFTKLLLQRSTKQIQYIKTH